MFMTNERTQVVANLLLTAISVMLAAVAINKCQKLSANRH